MLDWIWSNKDWLFSGVGVLMLVGIGKGIHGHFAHKRTPVYQLHDQLLQAISDSESHTITKDDEDVSPISPKGIVEAINRAPLLHQTDIIASYRGVQVEWFGYLISTEKLENGRVRLIVCFDKKHGLAPLGVFDIDPAVYPGLGVLREKHEIRVRGVIENYWGFAFVLKDVSIEYDMK